MRRELAAGTTRMQSHLRDVFDALARGRRSRKPRVCVTCRAEYVAARGVYPDPRCPYCAGRLANAGDLDDELGAGD